MVERQSERVFENVLHPPVEREDTPHGDTLPREHRIPILENLVGEVDTGFR